MLCKYYCVCITNVLIYGVNLRKEKKCGICYHNHDPCCSLRKEENCTMDLIFKVTSTTIT